MKFKPEELSYEALPSSCYLIENLVPKDSLVAAHVRDVLSIKLIPVHLPNSTFRVKIIVGRVTPFSCYKKRFRETCGANARGHAQDNSA